MNVLYPKPENYDTMTPQEKIRYRSRMFMRIKKNVKAGYIDDTGVPRHIRYHGSKENYELYLEQKKKEEEQRKQEKLKKRITCPCGIITTEGWYKKHLESATHAYNLRRLEIKNQN